MADELIDNSIECDADTFKLRVIITEAGDELSVVYGGARPSGLKEDSNVIFEGEYRSDNTLQTSIIILKFLSKYEPQERLLGTAEIGQSTMIPVFLAALVSVVIAGVGASTGSRCLISVTRAYVAGRGYCLFL